MDKNWFSQNRPEIPSTILRANHSFKHNSSTVWGRMLKFWVEAHHIIPRTLLIIEKSFLRLFTRRCAPPRGGRRQYNFCYNSLTVWDKMLKFCIQTKDMMRSSVIIIKMLWLRLFVILLHPFQVFPIFPFGKSTFWLYLFQIPPNEPN